MLKLNDKLMSKYETSIKVLFELMLILNIYNKPAQT
jgi:hypothetical protein